MHLVKWDRVIIDLDSKTRLKLNSLKAESVSKLFSKHVHVLYTDSTISPGDIGLKSKISAMEAVRDIKSLYDIRDNVAATLSSVFDEDSTYSS